MYKLRKIVDNLWQYKSYCLYWYLQDTAQIREFDRYVIDTAVSAL